MEPSAAGRDVAIHRLGDAALLLHLGDSIDVACNGRVHALAAALQAQAPAWLVGLTPAYASLAVHVDASRLDGDDPLATAAAWLRTALARTAGTPTPGRARVVEIPVLYGGEAGPDLAAVAAGAGLDEAAAAALHAASAYTVAMLGFAPGFPYLLGLDPRLQAPRHATPRARVAAGSVGIGGAQTGIYPAAGPGGWQIIGRTPLRLFDAARTPPCLLQAGDQVRFRAIDAAACNALEAAWR